MSSARSKPRSAEGKASGSLSALMAIYCAVHSTIPGICCRPLRKASTSTIPSKLIVRSHTARAIARIVPARALGSPMLARLASASTSGPGKMWVRPAGVEKEYPKDLARRPASAAAPLTVICCLKTARTASSNPFQHPGTRIPGAASILLASAPSARKADAIVDQSAFTSNIARIRSTMKNSARGSPN